MEIAEIKVSYTNRDTIRYKINESKDCYDLLKLVWDKDLIELQEEFKVLLLNRANVVLGLYPMSKGGTSGTIVDSKLLFSVALKCNANSIVLVHNHPSGNKNPSSADIDLTKRLKKASSLLGIEILDHIIMTKDSYFSFSDNSLL